MNEEELEIGKLIEILQSVRLERAEYERKSKALGKQQEDLEFLVIKQLQELQLEKASHNGITVEPKRETYPHVEDWGAFYDFILENKYMHLLEKRPTVTGYRELLALGRAVPGVVPYVKTKLSVRTS